MTEEHWGEGFTKSLGVFLNGKAIAHPDVRGRRIIDDSFYLLFNAHHEPIAFRLPRGLWGRRWGMVADTREPVPRDADRAWEAGTEVEVEARSVMVLRRMRGGRGSRRRACPGGVTADDGGFSRRGAAPAVYLMAPTVKPAMKRSTKKL